MIKRRDCVFQDGSYPCDYKDGGELPDCELCHKIRKAGMKEGIRLYAWWKDGLQYVGTTGMTLKEALEEIDKVKYSHIHIGHEPRGIR